MRIPPENCSTTGAFDRFRSLPVWRPAPIWPVRLDVQPIEAFVALESVDELLGLIMAEVGDPDAIDPVVSRLMFEAMGEAERNPALRERLGAMLGA